MNTTLIIVVSIILAVVIIATFIYFFANFRISNHMHCDHCGSERIRFLEINSIDNPDFNVDYSVYICADCENKIYKKIN